MRRLGGAARHRSREAALQVLYALDTGPPGVRGEPGEVFDDVGAHFELPGSARAFAEELVKGVAGCQTELDELLARHSANWRVERMAAVDRNILRLAAYELLHRGTPMEVVIDEAVELASRFAGERSPAFVNGVLDALARSLQAEAP